MIAVAIILTARYLTCQAINSKKTSIDHCLILNHQIIYILHIKIYYYIAQTFAALKQKLKLLGTLSGSS